MSNFGTPPNPPRITSATVPEDVTMLKDVIITQAAMLLNVSDRSAWSLVNKSKVLRCGSTGVT